MRTRHAAFAGLVLLLGAAAAFWWLGRAAPTLTVVSWPGAYGRAQANAQIHPFADQAWVNLRIAQYNGGIEQLRAQVRSGHPQWDVIDMELPDAVSACEQGLLEPIDTHTLPAGEGGVPAAADFVPGALGPCWVGNVVYSQVIGYAPARVSGRKPSTIADFFDLRRYPGPRGLRRDRPKFNLELALLADGLKPSDIYRTLQTRDGVTRALAKLDTIRPFIVWWSDPGTALKRLQAGAVVFSTLLNGDVFDAATSSNTIGAIWDRQLYELDVFAIPKGAPHQTLAMNFIRFATAPAQLAAMANWVPYGPARKSALPLVSRNPDLNLPMTPFLPTAKENFVNAFRIDDTWWLAHRAAIAPRWNAWLAGATATQAR